MKIADRWPFLKDIIANYWPLGIAFALYFPLIFLGYGSDPDSYLIADSTRKLINTGVYVPSRYPGYFVYELLNSFLIRGGSFWTNFGTLTASLIFITCFIYLLKYFAIPRRNLLALCLIIHPLYWTSSTVTMDYVWAMTFAFLGFIFFLKENDLLGSLFLSLSIGSRLSSFIMVMAIIVFLYFQKNLSLWRIAEISVVSFLGGAIFYVPSFIESGFNFVFLKAGIGGPELWTNYLRLGRFFYKNIYFWGFLAFIFILLIAYLLFKNSCRLPNKNWINLCLTSLIVIIGFELLFFKYPIEKDYLLPVLPFFLFILGIALRNKPRIIITFMVLLFSYGFINFNLANPINPGQATGATFGFSIEKGYLIQDINDRLKLKSCESITCVNDYFARTIDYQKSNGN